MRHSSQMMKSQLYIFLAQSGPQDTAAREVSRKALGGWQGARAGSFQKRDFLPRYDYRTCDSNA